MVQRGNCRSFTSLHDLQSSPSGLQNASRMIEARSFMAALAGGSDVGRGLSRLFFTIGVILQKVVEDAMFYQLLYLPRRECTSG